MENFANTFDNTIERPDAKPPETEMAAPWRELAKHAEIGREPAEEKSTVRDDLYEKAAQTMRDVTVQKGDIIFVDRGLYRHYGIYNNENSVYHYSPKSGMEISQENAEVRETSLKEFLKDGRLEIDRSVKPVYSPDEIIARARALMGEKSYDLFSNNCEHFTTWCAAGKQESKQVNDAYDIVESVAGGLAVGALAVGAIALIDKIQSDDGKS